MEFSINNGNHFLTFVSPINRDNGYSSEKLGDFESTMELFISEDENGDFSGEIEWTIEKLGMVEHIGIWCNQKKLCDYDGVFELPKEAIELLKHAGFTVGEDFE